MIELTYPLTDIDQYIILGTIIIGTILIGAICALAYLIDGHLGQTPWWEQRYATKRPQFRFK